MTPVQTMASGITPGSGLVQVTTPSLSLDGPGAAFSQKAVWSNSGEGDGAAGNGTTQSDKPYLAQLNGDFSIAMVTCTLTPFYFDQYDLIYNPRWRRCDADA